MLGGAWPGSRSRPGAQAEARARPRSASRARGERFSVPGVGSDKGQRGLAAWQGGFPVPLGRELSGGEADGTTRLSSSLEAPLEKLSKPGCP